LCCRRVQIFAGDGTGPRLEAAPLGQTSNSPVHRVERNFPLPNPRNSNPTAGMGDVEFKRPRNANELVLCFPPLRALWVHLGTWTRVDAPIGSAMSLLEPTGGSTHLVDSGCLSHRLFIVSTSKNLDQSKHSGV
jgi:hypothetical protein